MISLKRVVVCIIDMYTGRLFRCVFFFQGIVGFSYTDPSHQDFICCSNSVGKYLHLNYNTGRYIKSAPHIDGCGVVKLVKAMTFATLVIQSQLVNLDQIHTSNMDLRMNVYAVKWTPVRLPPLWRHVLLSATQVVMSHINHCDVTEQQWLHNNRPRDKHRGAEEATCEVGRTHFLSKKLDKYKRAWQALTERNYEINENNQGKRILCFHIPYAVFVVWNCILRLSCAVLQSWCFKVQHTEWSKYSTRTIFFVSRPKGHRPMQRTRDSKFFDLVQFKACAYFFIQQAQEWKFGMLTSEMKTKYIDGLSTRL